jgi:hypothetical protein
VTSPGFGGAAAVVAAVIAFIGVSRNLKAQRNANRKQQWWERARWALDLTLDDDSSTRAVGFEVLDALARSEYADEHEAEVIDAAVSATLEAYVEQDDEDGVPDESNAGADDTSQAQLEPPGEENDHG